MTTVKDYSIDFFMDNFISKITKINKVLENAINSIGHGGNALKRDLTNGDEHSLTIVCLLNNEYIGWNLYFHVTNKKQLNR